MLVWCSVPYTCKHPEKHKTLISDFMSISLLKKDLHLPHTYFSCAGWTSYTNKKLGENGELLSSVQGLKRRHPVSSHERGFW